VISYDDGMARVLSGIQPSGAMHLGNYFGAVRNWVTEQERADAYYCIVDLHALTLSIDPAVLRRQTVEAACVLLAAGLDPERCTLFVQSHVPAHQQLTWLLECTATMGELRRMTQFKDKGGGQESVRVGLFTYPVLMAADILLYDADEVPVGDDQRQHLELTREIAQRFNHHYGEIFTVPTATIPAVAARVMDLQHPERKMSKSVGSPLGTIGILDTPAEIERKVKKAVTDTDGEVRYDPEGKPGVANLLSLLGAATSSAPGVLAERYERYGDLKRDVAEALSEALKPLQERYAAVSDDLGEVERTLSVGATQAAQVAEATYRRAADAVGLLAPMACPVGPGTNRTSSPPNARCDQGNQCLTGSPRKTRDKSDGEDWVSGEFA
jgi:tryptophanyl-tRNA synthetase